MVVMMVMMAVMMVMGGWGGGGGGGCSPGCAGGFGGEGAASERPRVAGVAYLWWMRCGVGRRRCAAAGEVSRLCAGVDLGRGVRSTRRATALRSARDFAAASIADPPLGLPRERLWGAGRDDRGRAYVASARGDDLRRADALACVWTVCAGLGDGAGAGVSWGCSGASASDEVVVCSDCSFVWAVWGGRF